MSYYSDSVFKGEFMIEQKHIDVGGTSIDDNPIVRAIEDHIGEIVFITPLSVYITDIKYGSPSWDKMHELKDANHKRLCRTGKKLWRWLNDWETAWNDLLRPEPVTLECVDDVLNVKGEYTGIFDLKTYCEVDDVTNLTGECDCFACENEELDFKIWKARGVASVAGV